MKSGAQFNRPNKHTEGPATRVNKQNLNFRLRIQGFFFKDLLRHLKLKERASFIH